MSSVTVTDDGITCPKCGLTSYHPEDIRHRYCGNCHESYDQMEFEPGPCPHCGGESDGSVMYSNPLQTKCKICRRNWGYGPGIRIVGMAEGLMRRPRMYFQVKMMTTDDPKKLKQRIEDLMFSWAPMHAREMMRDGWRLSDGDGLVWVRNDKPSLRITDEAASDIWHQRQDLKKAIRDAGDRRDGDSVDRLEKKLSELPTIEEAAAQ